MSDHDKSLERRIRNDIAGQIWRAEQEIHDVHRAAGRFVYDQNALGQLTGLQRARDIASGDNRDFEFDRELTAHDARIAREAAERALREAAESILRSEAALPGMKITDAARMLRNRARRYACDTGTVERPCRGCPDCMAGPAVGLPGRG